MENAETDWTSFAERPVKDRLLLALEAFLVVTAIPAGLMLIAKPDGSLIKLSPSLLYGSPFGSYLLPGSALAFGVGGSALTAAFAIWHRFPLARWVSLASGLILAVWITVQILAIGFRDPLQAFMAFLAFLICLLSLSGGRRHPARFRKLSRPDASGSGGSGLRDWNPGRGSGALGEP